MIKVKEHIDQLGFCSVHDYSKTGKRKFLLLHPVRIYITDKHPIHTMFDWKVKHSQDPQLFVDLLYFYGNTTEKKIMIITNPFCIF